MKLAKPQKNLMTTTVDVIYYVASKEELLLKGFPLKGTLKSVKSRSLLSLLNLLKTFFKVVQELLLIIPVMLLMVLDLP